MASANNHPQPDELATAPDETPSRGRVIGIALAVYLFMAWVGYFFLYQFSPTVENVDPATAATTAADIVSPYPLAAYAAPLTDTLLTAEQRALGNLLVANDTVGLATLLGENPQITTIYLHPDSVTAIDPTWLAQQFATGKTLVALNTPQSVLTAVVGLESTQPDRVIDPQFLTIVVVRHNGDDAPLVFTAAYNGFDQIPAVVQGLR